MRGLLWPALLCVLLVLQPPACGKAQEEEAEVEKPQEVQEVQPPPSSQQDEFQTCHSVVVGAGWGGTYFAWRTTVDGATPMIPPHTMCVFEATNRVGGRAYSKEGIPGMDDLRIDLAAYRFDTHSHPLIQHVVTDVLKNTTRCYGEDSTCNDAGNMRTFADAYGNNAGYSTGPEGLMELARRAGVRLYLNSPLTGIFASGDTQRPILLQFNNTVNVRAASAFLNMPSQAIRNLNKKSLFFTEASTETQNVLFDLPKQQIGAKQFLIYPAATWRLFPELRTGDVTAPGLPPLTGRLNDFYGKCPVSAVQTDEDGDCWGAILTYYDFVEEETKYFAKFQHSTSDPYTYIPLNEETPAAEREMILDLHERFLNELIKKNVSGFDVHTVSQPSGTVIAVWWARPDDVASGYRPSYSNISTVDGPYMSDPLHYIRNRISKPLDRYPVYVANEAYSGGDGWAHPSLIMTERIIWKYISGKQTPRWVNSECDDNNCFLGISSPDKPSCVDCVSMAWWDSNIVANQELVAEFVPNCSHRTALDLVEVVVDDSGHPQCAPVPPRDTNVIVTGNLHCDSSVELTGVDQGSLRWSWVNASHIEVNFRMKAEAWVGLGIGGSMSNADVVLARRITKTKLHVGHYSASGHRAPTPVVLSDDYVYDMHASILEDDSIEVTFKRPATHPAAQVNISIDCLAGPTDCPTPIIYAISDSVSPAAEPLLKHTFRSTMPVNFGCGRRLPVTFEKDIRPLFRQKDRDAMLFALDLYNCADVMNSAKDILSRLQDRTVLGLETGMPKDDAAWTEEQIQLFKQWMDDSYVLAPGQGTFCEGVPPIQNVTFYGNIQSLFRPEDIVAMAPYMDLTSYDDVKLHAEAILNEVSSRRMPCDAAGAWNESAIALFEAWMRGGYQKGEGGILKDTIVFHRALNIEGNPQWLPELKEALKNYLKQARAAGEMASRQPGGELWKFEPYTEETFRKRMDDIYSQLVEEAAAYDPAKDSRYVTREQVVNRIIQLTPFNMVDGAWISGCCPVSPFDEVHSMLWGILNDEMGGGDITKHHALLYEALLDSLDIKFAPIPTLQFIEDPRFIPEAFTVPAYAVVLPIFSKEFFPELLGTTLQIEWKVLGLWPATKLLEYWGIDTHFYHLHIGIDNAAQGHGFRARRAVEIFLNEVRQTSGDAGVQEAWRRIWDGYLAFDVLGNLFDKLQQMNEQLLVRTPEMELVELMTAKAKFGAQNHNEKRLGTTLLNQHFGNPLQFAHSLRDSAWIVAGNPSASPLMSYLASFDGPMFKVFDDDELDVWRRWITSLRVDKRIRGPIDWYDAMRELVKRVGMIGMSVEQHRGRMMWGPAPQAPTAITQPPADPESAMVEQPVAMWLEAAAQNPDVLMAALIHPRNRLITCGHSANHSSFITRVLSNNSPMGKVYERAAVDILDEEGVYRMFTWKDIVSEWIQANCPMRSTGGAKLFGPPMASLHAGLESLRRSGLKALTFHEPSASQMATLDLNTGTITKEPIHGPTFLQARREYRRVRPYIPGKHYVH